MLANNRLGGLALPNFVQPIFAEEEEARGERDRPTLEVKLAIINPFCEQLIGLSPGGPCPNSSEFVAANISLFDISLFASRVCVFGRVLTTDSLLNVGGTLGAIRRTANDRYIIERAVRDLRNLSPAKITTNESAWTEGRHSRTRLRGARPARI